jgi:hypothetical protein
MHRLIRNACNHFLLLDFLDDPEDFASTLAGSFPVETGVIFSGSLFFVLLFYLLVDASGVWSVFSC